MQAMKAASSPCLKLSAGRSSAPLSTPKPASVLSQPDVADGLNTAHLVSLLCSGLTALHCSLAFGAVAAAPVITPGSSPYLEAKRIVSVSGGVEEGWSTRVCAQQRAHAGRTGACALNVLHLDGASGSSISEGAQAWA